DVRVGPSGQGVRRPDRRPLLTEGAEQTADHLALAVEGGEPLLQGPGEPQVAIDFKQLVAGEARRYGRRLRDRCGARWHDVNCSGRETWLDGAGKSSSGARRPYGDVEAARDGDDVPALPDESRKGVDGRGRRVLCCGRPFGWQCGHVIPVTRSFNVAI